MLYRHYSPDIKKNPSHLQHFRSIALRPLSLGSSFLFTISTTAWLAVWLKYSVIGMSRGSKLTKFHWTILCWFKAIIHQQLKNWKSPFFEQVYHHCKQIQGKKRDPNEDVFVAALFSPYPFWYSFIDLFVHLNYIILVVRDNPKDVL